MTMLYDLARASFRGARFLCPKDSASEGRNSIDHKFPDANYRYAEDNGYTPPEFTITAVLHDEPGSSAIQKFKSLRAALNRPGPGTLHHPYYGSQLCAVKGPWKVSREDTDLGVITLEICFLVTGPGIFPARSAAIASAVTSLNSSFVASAVTTLTTIYGSVQASGVTTDTMAAAVQSIAESFLDLSAAADVAIASRHLDNNAAFYAINGEGLGEQLKLLFRGSFEDDAYSGAEIARGLARVESTMIEIYAAGITTPASTADYEMRGHLLSTLGIYCQAMALSCLCEAAVGATYETADSVHAAAVRISDSYQVIERARFSGDLGEQLRQTVDTALSVLGHLELQLPRIEKEPLLYPMPASVLSYMLYDTDDRTQTIIDLNAAQNPILLIDSAAVLTGVS